MIPGSGGRKGGGQMRMCKRWTRRPRAAAGWLAAALWLAGAGALSAQDAYFRKTKSDANVYVAPVPSSIAKVAVMPFKAPTELIGSSVSDIFVTEILRTRRYTLVERSQIDRVLGEAELALSGLSESAAIEAGKMLGADGVILGTVDEYGTVAHRGQSYPVVGASIRLIDCDSGRVMWSVGQARRAKSPLDTLSRHARDVVHEMVAAVVQNWNVQRQVHGPPQDALAGRDRPEAPVWAGDEPATARLEIPPPDAPAGFALSDLGLREVRLTWTPLADRSDQIRIERADSPDGPFVSLATLAASKGAFADLGLRNAPLEDAKTYYYRLIRIGRNGQESLPTETRESMTAPPPAPPAGLRATTPAGRAVGLEWEPSEDEGIVKYLVERAEAPDGEFLPVGEVPQASFREGGSVASPLADSTTYLYRICAMNRVGAGSVPSEPVAVTTRPPPAPPLGLAAESRQVRCVPLAWNMHPEDDVVRYDIYRADGADAPFAFLASRKGRENTSFLDGGANPGTLEDDHAYIYRLRAVNAVAAESGDSKPAPAMTRPRPPRVEGLDAVTGLPRCVELSWNASPDERVVGYEVERSEAGGAFIGIARVDGLESTRYRDQGDEASRFLRARLKTPLKDGTAYVYRVRALNTAQAASDWCAPVSATTKVVPKTPAGLTASEGKPRVIRIAWSANKENDISEYVVEAAPAADRGFAEVARLAADAPRVFSQENLPANLVRFYRVKAVDADGLESPWSDPVTGSSKPLPDAPANLALEWTNDGAFLRWTAPPQKDIERYRILNKKLFGQEEVANATGREYFFPIEALAQRKVLLVVAVDRDGLESLPSTPLDVRPPR